MLSKRKERNATPNREHEADGCAQKKARYGSGLNLSLEENRGDMSIMLHRKIKSQFILSMTVIDHLNSTPEVA
jgi:hypothetical protein